jgi:N6-adenosine-specific RNA methylase IME4
VPKVVTQYISIPKRNYLCAPITYEAQALETLISLGHRFRTIYADPPWPYTNTRSRGAAARHYPSMSLEEIAALPVRNLAEDSAHLHLWVTNAFLLDAKGVIESWGFRYRSMLVWCKPNLGCGNYWRVSHELLLFGVRDRLPFRDHAQRSWLCLPRGAHSSKPDQIRLLIEKCSPPPYLELFARRLSPGWTVWGNAIERTLLDTDTPTVRLDEPLAIAGPHTHRHERKVPC